MNQFEVTKTIAIIQSYFSEKISTNRKGDNLYILLDDKPIDVMLLPDYEDVVMKIYINSGKVDPRAIDTIKSLME